MLFRLCQGSLKLYCYFEICFHIVFHGISLVFGLMKGQYCLVTQSLITFPDLTYKLETDKVDAQPDQAQDLSRTSRSGKEKVHDVLFWSTIELTDVGRLISLTNNSNSENEQFGINTSILSPRFHNNMICKVLPFNRSTFNKSQCYNAQSEILFVLSQGQPLCIHVGPRKGSLFQSILACQGIT